MSTRVLIIDSFVERPFTGNPAAVCLFPGTKDDRWMQNVAAEMNLAATAFVRRGADGFDLRWFSAWVELALCGHGTLAAAHAMWEEGEVAPEERIRFATAAGPLIATRDGGWIDLDFPAERAQETVPPENLIRALSVQPTFVGANRLDHLVVVEDEETVRALQPDLDLLATVPTRGAMVTAPSSSDEYAFVSRYFAPAVGIPEDHVTGSAHCCLGPFWGERLGRSEMLAYQASRRGGVVRVRLAGERVHLGGRALTALRGEVADALET
jgi:PhzF family phenazine biosynthesis protein